MYIKKYLLTIILSTLVLTARTQKPGSDIRNSFFTIHPGKGDHLWTYRMAGGKELAIGVPVFVIDSNKLQAFVKEFTIHTATDLPNGTKEQIFEGPLVVDSSINLSITFRWAKDNPMVRFRYILTSNGHHHFSKPNGTDELRYLSLSLKGQTHFKEIRLSDFNERTHATHPGEFPIGKKEFDDSSAVMGPMLEGRDDSSSFLLAYEHGSTFPNRFLEFCLSSAHSASSSAYSVSLKAVKGNYLDGQPLDGQHNFETIWFEIGGIDGNEDKLASNYRTFILKYISQNLESRKPYIYYNTWGRQERTKWAGGKYLSSMNLAITLKEIEVAHRMGIEVYVLDAGWFTTTGDWRVNTQFFPDSLRQVKALLDQYGMKLGLWFNPTVAALSSAMLKRNTNFRMEWQGKKDNPFPIWETENSVRFDLVSPYWNDFADKLIQLIWELGVVYFKWDAVEQYGCDGPGHYHGTATNSRQERADSYAFQLPTYMSKVIDKVCAVAPQAIFDFDITEPGRSMGLEFLSSGKYFIMNNGPYFDNYNLAVPGQSPLSNGNTNIFVNPGPARGWITRSVLAYDKWIPSILFLTHYQPDEPRNSQLINVASLIAGQNGIWGEILKTSPEGIELFHTVLDKYKQVRGDVTLSELFRIGEPGDSPEIVEKINGVTGRGMVTLFANKAGQYQYITEHPVDRQVWHTPDTKVSYDAAGRAIIQADFQGSSARIVFFGIQ
ncbi:alpha-galactosidase [Flavitalea flava]